MIKVTMTRVKATTAGTAFSSSSPPLATNTSAEKTPKIESPILSLPKPKVMGDLVHLPIRLARAGSSASEITGDCRSSDSVEHQAESQRMESTPTEWTDEKHSLYLKSMEASFVEQLYNSSDLNNLRSQKDGSSDSITSRKIHANSYIPSGQFKVLQGGCWSKINFKRDESQLSKGTQSHALPANPWIRHFRTGSRQVPPPQNNLIPASASQQVIASHKHSCQRDQNACNTEASGQNFPDEDVASEKTSEMNSMKRMRTTLVASSSNDQVVPLIFPIMEDVAKNYASLQK